MKTRIASAVILVSTVSTLTALAGDKIPLKVSDTFSPPPPGAVKIGGHLGDALNLCISNRIAAQDVPHIITPFRERKDNWEWRAEFWGKWITSAEWAERYTGDPALRAKIGGAVTDLLTTQTPDGYIGAHPDGGHLKNWDIWGRKYTLLGLLGWNDLSGDEVAISAAMKHADFLLSEVGPGKASPLKDMWNGMAASSIIEPMTLLYRRTGEQRYLDYVNYVIGLWPTTNGPDLLSKVKNSVPVFDMFPKPKPVAEQKNYGDGGKSKAYEMMSCFEGLCELYRTTGKPEYFEAPKKLFAGIRETEITIIGSGSEWERWCDGKRRQTEPWKMGMETCVSVTWMKLANQLLRLTGDPMYADEIERAAYNALLGAQGLDGTWWCHHAPLAGVKEKAPEHCGMHQNCCVASGPRGLMLLPQIAVMSSKDGPVVNFYGDIAAEIPLASGNKVRVEQKSDYPVGDTIQISVAPGKPEIFALRLRIPDWSRESSISINGEKQTAPRAGNYAELRREWKAGDSVTLKLDLRTRLVHAPGHADFVAITRGPLVFARDRRLEAGDIDAVVAIKADADGIVNATVSTDHKIPNGWMVCSVPLADGTSLAMCDFSASGNTWGEDSKYRVWMPLAAATPAK